MRSIQLRRSIAFIIDMGIISNMVFIFDNLFPVTIWAGNVEVSGIQLTLGITLAPVFYVLYFIVFDIAHNGRSIGKLILGIFVVSKTGEALNTRKRLRRSLYKMLAILTFTPLVGVMIFIFDDFTVHDYCTDTETIKADKMLKIR